MSSSDTRHRCGLALALALLCLGLFAPAALGAEFKYVLDEDLSLTGDCSTSAADEVKDPDCKPTYPTPPDGPSGRFNRPFSITVDDWGNTYVASFAGDGTQGRIDIFDPEGGFITELPDPFGPWTTAVDGEGNLYAYEALAGVAEAPPPSIVRYPPTTYNPAAGEIAYDPDDREVIASWTPGSPEINFVFNGLAIDRANASDPTDDRLYVAEGERISIFSAAEDGNTLVDRIEPVGGFNFSTYIAVDAQRRILYTVHCKEGNNKCVVWALDADDPYTFLAEINGSNTPNGKFFSSQGRITVAVDETNGHLFVGDLSAKDEVFEFDSDYDFLSSFKVPGAPMSSAGVQSDVAENPKDPDPDDLNPADNYRHLYIPLANISGNAYAFEPPAIGPPVIEDAEAANIGETEAEVSAQVKPGQLPGTYEIEYVSEAQFQIDGFDSATVVKTGTLPAVKPPQQISALIGDLEPGESYRFRVFAENELGSDEAQGAFTTFADDTIDKCPNDALRTGLSAALPDCRAYELVTPPGARGPSGSSFDGQRFGALQASPDGSKVSFEINSGALPGTEASGYFFGDPYLATRTDSGWSTKLAGATGTMSSEPKPGSFSPDQGHSFFSADGTGTAVVGGLETTYVRYPDGSSELIGRGSLNTDPRAQGRLITEGGGHIVFESNVKLEPTAAGGGAVYDRTSDEVTHVVSLLPGDVTPGQPASFAGASADGEGIAFTIGTTLYLRTHNTETHAIGAGAQFAGIADGGERIFYLEAGDLKAFDADTEAETDFTGGAVSVATPVNVAPQGTRAYFVSETATGAANPEGDTAQAGEQNLYLSEEGTVSFIATLTEEDVEGRDNGAGARGHGLGLWIESLEKRQPAIDPSRLTPDGTVFAFESEADLTGYQPGAEAQVYRYDSVADLLDCVSCPPTETPATGGAKLQSLGSLESAPFDRYAFVPALRADGERLFFESDEALVSTDTDGRLDVYEWEQEGVGSCKEAGGCLYLISSPASAKAEFIFGHSQSGDDVFIYTSDVLVPGNPKTIAIYDARVGGGFATKPVIDCEGEGCRPGMTPPPVLPPAQSGPAGPPVAPKPPQAKKPKKCPKGKRKAQRKGKTVCIKKKKQQGKNKGDKQRRSASERRAGR